MTDMKIENQDLVRQLRELHEPTVPSHEISDEDLLAADRIEPIEAIRAIDIFGPRNEEERRIGAEQGLFIDVSVLIYERMLAVGVDNKELAKRLEVSTGRVKKILEGSNLTLKTLADVMHALGCEVEVRVKSYDEVEKKDRDQ